MDYRTLGRTHLRVSALSFGCGAVGGVLVKGERRERVQAVARAVELGINYFDTAPVYGDGLSEMHLGEALAELGTEPTVGVLVGTKVRLRPEQMADLEPAVTASVDASLRRLRRECVDLIQLHNFVAAERRPERQWVSVADVAAVSEVFRKLHAQGKVRHWGMNALGEPAAVQQAVRGNVQSMQTYLNLLNPTAAVAAPPGFPFTDYARVIDTAAANDVGVIVIRTLAGGALSGTDVRHTNAAANVDRIASAGSYADDVVLAQRFAFLVEEGYVENLVEAAVRFVLGFANVATTAIGISDIPQLEQLVGYAAKGPLPAAALARLPAVWASFAG